MDGWLKALVGTACVVVIAGGCYFAWLEWQRLDYAAQARDALARRIEHEAHQVREATRRAEEEQKRAAELRSTAIPRFERNHCHQQLTSLRLALKQQSPQVSLYREEVQRCIDANYIPATAADGLME